MLVRATLLMYMSIQLTNCECMYHTMTKFRWQMGVHTSFLDIQESAEITCDSLITFFIY